MGTIYEHYGAMSHIANDIYRHVPHYANIPSQALIDDIYYCGLIGMDWLLAYFQLHPSDDDELKGAVLRLSSVSSDLSLVWDLFWRLSVAKDVSDAGYLYHSLEAVKLTAELWTLVESIRTTKEAIFPKAPP